jgi:deoxycytidylate deaminase
MFLPWYPCVDCARAIIQSGIRELVCYKPDFNDPKWGEDFKIAARMFSEAGIVETFEEPWVPLSPAAQAALDAGIESAKTEPIVIRDEDFSQYAEDDGEIQ